MQTVKTLLKSNACFKQFGQFRNVKNDAKTKISEAAIKVKERHREEKLLFGGVVESLKEKHKRLEKLKEENVAPQEEVRVPNSEKFWLLKWNSKDVRILRKTPDGTFMEVSKEQVLKELEQTEDIRETLPVDKTESIKKKLGIGKKRKKKPSSAVSMSGTKIAENVEKSEAPEVVLDKPEAKLHLPHIIISNMTNFPMLSNSLIKSESKFSKKQFAMMPSVTKVLTKTMSDSSKAALERWKKNMIAELGEEGFNVYSQGLLRKGAQFHKCVKHHLEGSPVDIDQDMEGCWHSLHKVLTNVSDVIMLEAEVIHPRLLYKGIVDCVASYKDKPAVIEWKKADKLKPEIGNTYDAPLQLCAYIGALSHDPRYSNHKFLENGYVIVAYTDGTPAQVFHLELDNCIKYWNKWLQRLQFYWSL